MKQSKFPVWIFCLLIGLLTFAGFGYYVIHQSTLSKEHLVTLQGDPSKLEDVTLGLTTSLSGYQDFLQTTVTLGATLHSDSSFINQLGSPRSSLSNTFSEVPEISYASTLHEKKIGSTIPFTFSSYSMQKKLDFPYLTIDTPSDLTYLYDENNNCYDYNYYIDVETTDFATIGDKKYFSIKTIVKSLPEDGRTTTSPAYTLDGEIFMYDGTAVTKVYGGSSTADHQTLIVNLFNIDALHCLGLVVIEDNTCVLKLIDPNTGALLGEHILSKSVSATSNVEVSYNASSNCLLLASDTLLCYHIISPTEVTLADSYDWAFIRSRLKAEYKDSACFDDFLYKDKTLYLVDSMEYIPRTYSPHLIALNKDQVLYEGYVIMNATEDYSSNRYAVNTYEGEHGSKLGMDTWYHCHNRESGQFTLSATNSP